jgi:ribokinase
MSRTTPESDADGRRGPTIVVVGSANVDLVASMPRFPGPGETILGNGFATTFGGKGANQAVMAARLGGRVALIARVGSDAHADAVLADLAAEGIGISHVLRVAGPTGVASIWVDAAGSNRIAVIPGANHVFEPAAAGAAIAAIGTVDVIVGQLEVPQAVTAAAFAAARALGAVAILNPAPAAPLDPALLRATDWLIPNEVEFAMLAVRGTVPGDPTAGAGPPTPAAMAALAADLGVRLVVTLGAAGAALVREDGSVAAVAAPQVDVIDTTGAGDAFVGSFAHAIGSGRSELAAVGQAVRLASDSVTRPGARASFPKPGPPGDQAEA